MNNYKKLVDHISRLEGQLAAVKKELAQSSPDCDKASKTLLSASRSFATLREQFVSCFLDSYFESKTNKKEKALTSLLTLIRG